MMAQAALALLENHGDKVLDKISLNELKGSLYLCAKKVIANTLSFISSVRIHQCSSFNALFFLLTCMHGMDSPGQFSEAEQVFRSLLQRNPENRAYFLYLEEALGYNDRFVFIVW